MDSRKALERLELELKRERQRNHGRKAVVDQALGHKEGYLRRKIGTGSPLKIDQLLIALEAMDVEPADFFARSYDILPRAEELLGRQERPGAPEKALAAIEAAALAIEADGPADGELPRATRTREQLETFSRSQLRHQRAVLRKESWPRNPAVLRVYLELVDALRFDRAEDAAALAETVAVEVIPDLVCPQEERLGLLCHAIGAFASARRVKARYATAARAAVFGLRLAGRHGLMVARAALLQRGAYVLRDAGAYDHALVLLNEALVLYTEQESPADVGKTMVDRAIIFGHNRDYVRSETAFRVALDYLSGDEETHRQNRLAAAHGIAVAQLRLGDTAEAERWLERATELLGDTDSSVLAKLIWHKGEIYYAKGAYPQAERAFSDARKILEVRENPIQGALVALDVAAALHAQGKSRALRDLAKEMTALLQYFKDNKLAEAALLEFIRAGLSDEVTEELIQGVGKRLGRAHPPLGVRPLKP